MKQVPYYGNPDGSWCALACYTMVAQYLLPDKHVTFEQLRDLAEARPGYVVWAFPVWKWLMDQTVHIEDYDISSMELMAKEGIEGLRKGVPPDEFEYYKSHTFDLEQVCRQAALVMDNPNFKFEQKKVMWDMIQAFVKKPGICDLTLDGRKLHRREGMSVHRVVLIDITDSEVIFHDPTEMSDGANKHESIEFFKAAVESLSGAELCYYYL